MIFVFGSNRAGVHGAGAAAFAHQHHGAQFGVGEGLTGNSYALPTCDHHVRPLTLDQIRFHVDRFIDFASKNPRLQFQVTRVGCGIAGYRDAQIAPFFVTAPDNVWLPSAWLRFYAHQPHIPAINSRRIDHATS